jgi:hypothetical protein
LGLRLLKQYKKAVQKPKDIFHTADSKDDFPELTVGK